MDTFWEVKKLKRSASSASSASSGSRRTEVGEAVGHQRLESRENEDNRFNRKCAELVLDAMLRYCHRRFNDLARTMGSGLAFFSLGMAAAGHKA